MRYCLLLLVLLLHNILPAQSSIPNLKEIKPKEEYKNIKVIPVYSDSNASAFVIFIKKAVRKHKHEFHTEMVTVLEGKAEFFLGKERMIIKKGDQITIPPNTPHAVLVKGRRPLKVLSIQAPEFKGVDRVFLDQ